MCCVLLDLENVWNPLRPRLLVFWGFFWLGDDGWWDGYAWVLEFASSEEGPDGFVEKSEMQDWGAGVVVPESISGVWRTKRPRNRPRSGGEEGVANV